MAIGGDNVKPKDSVMTRATTGKAKQVGYKQMTQGNYRGATWGGGEFDSDRSNNDSDTGLYQDPDDVIRSEEDPFMGTGKPRGKLPLHLPRGDLDFQLAAEEEELALLQRQLEAARKEQEILKRHSEADEWDDRLQLNIKWVVANEVCRFQTLFQDILVDSVGLPYYE